MPFIDSSSMSNSIFQQGPMKVATLQNVVVPNIPAPAETIGKAISSTIGSVSSTVKGLSATASSTERAIPGTVSVAEASVNSFVQSALRSSIGTFDSATKSLASGISKSLSGLFKNTNVKTVSTVTTDISDPVKTNLLQSKPPASTAFKVSSLESGSQAVAVPGSSSTIGTGALKMTGTNLSTVLNRLNLDIKSVPNLPGAIARNFSASAVNGLFANLTGNVGSAAGSVVGSITKNPFAEAFAGSFTTSLIASSIGLGTRNGVASRVSNDIQSFLGRASPISNALGGRDLSGYYISNPNYTLLDQSNNPVLTNKSGVDATTANAILSILNMTGCSTGGVINYNSANEYGSIFNLGLSLAAQNGMGSLVTSLLGCSHATTPMGQQALGQAFAASAGSQITVADGIIGAIQAPTTIIDPALTTTILSNPNLTSADIPTLNSVLSQLGTTPKKAMSVSDISTDTYPVYDTSILAGMKSSTVDSVLEDPTWSNYYHGVPMVWNTNGDLVAQS